MTKQNRCLVLFAALSTCTSLLGASERALAVQSLVVDTGAKQSLGRDQPYFYNTVTLKTGGTLSVLGAGSPNGTGRLHIKANRIILESDALLDAKGAGHKGVTGAAGDGMGGGGFLMMSGGGGGAYFGKGGAATNGMCGTGAAFASGGSAYGDVMTFALGSAGGSSGAALGGAGGGTIILEAATIEINGTITADGNPGLALSGNGSGGGAGGDIRLLAHTLVWGAKAKVSAVGGKGASTTNNGGSGGGGLIMLRGGGTAPDPLIFDVTGGAAALAGCATNAGGNGVLDQDPMSVCPDLDGDGVLASLCAGNTEDCDDADPAINPSASEICDGVDNDCNGQIDDGQTDCAMGLTCQGGMCVGDIIMDGGTGDGGVPKGEFRVEYRGGCAVSPSNEAGTKAALSLGLLALSMGMIRRIKSKRVS